MPVTKKTGQEIFLFFFFLIYIVKSEDANYWQREKEESLRKSIDETRPAKC